MEEAVWGPPQENENTSPRVFDSNSILKTYQRKQNTSVWLKMKSVINGVFNTLAVLGWVAGFVLLYDGFFNNARLLSWLLAG